MINDHVCKTIAYSILVIAFLLGTSSIVIFDRWIDVEQFPQNTELQKVNPDGTLSALSKDLIAVQAGVEQ